MILLMYHSQMLSPEQLRQIPRTTKNDWNRFLHQDYFGYDMAKDYIADFDYIKEILLNKHLKMGVRVLCAISYGYKDLLSEIGESKKMLREHAHKISFSIEQLARYGNLKLSEASALFGVNRDWFYRHRQKKHVKKAKLENVSNNILIN